MADGPPPGWWGAWPIYPGPAHSPAQTFGWVCPLCTRVHAPHVNTCSCNLSMQPYVVTSVWSLPPPASHGWDDAFEPPTTEN